MNPDFLSSARGPRPRSLALAALVAGVSLALSVPPAACGREQDDDAESEATAIVAAISRRQALLADVADDYRVVRLWPGSDAYLSARDALEQPCDGMELLETPLRDAVARIADRAGTPIGLDLEAFADMGLEAETPVTAPARPGSLKACLLAILDDLDLALVFRHGQFMVTSADEAAEELEQVLYPLFPDVDPGDMAAMIQDAVAPHSWAAAGGPGTIAAAPAGMGNGLVVSQTGPAHDQIEAVLRGLDAAHWIQPDADENARPHFVRVYEIDDDLTLVDLQAKLVDLVNDSLAHGADAEAEITSIGRTLVVRSHSRPFQVMAAQIIAAVTGMVEEFEVDTEALEDADEDAADEPSPAAMIDTQRT